MKTKISILLCALFFLTNCTKDDENINPIIGSWSLVQLTGGFAGSTQNYNPGEITWTFGEDILTIEDNLTNNEDERHYTLIEHENSLFIDFNDDESIFGDFFFYIEINGDEVIINQGVARIIIENDTMPTGISDGYIYSFERQ